MQETISRATKAETTKAIDSCLANINSQHFRSTTQKSLDAPPDASERFFFVSGMLHGHVNKVKVNREPSFTVCLGDTGTRIY